MESNKANIVEAFNQNREAITGAQQQISTDHGYIHSGLGFSYSKNATVNTGAKLLLLFKTGANKHIHLRPTAISSISGAVTLKFKEGGTYVKPAGTLVAGEEEDLTFTSFTQPVALSKQNYDGGEITVNSVTGSVDGLLTVTDHYENSQDVLSAWGIQLNDGDGVLVPDAAQVMNFASFLETVEFEHQNHDGSLITVVSVTGSVDGLLTVTDHYAVVKSGDNYFLQLVDGDGTKVVGATQDFTTFTEYAQNIAFENQNHDGSEIAITSLTGSVDGLLIENTDYDVIKVGDNWGVQLILAAGIIVAGETDIMSTFTSFLDIIAMEHQNWNGGAITVNSVTGSVDGLLVDSIDYNVVTDGNGDYGIQLLESAGTPVAGETQIINTFTSFEDKIAIENQNWDGSAITVNSVIGSVDGALVENTDFQVTTDLAGDYAIQLLESAGALVPGASQVLVENTFTDYEQFAAMENQNWDGGAITVNSVTGSVNGALVENTDFEVILSGSDYGIQIIESGGTTVSGEIDVVDFASYSEIETMEYQNWDGSILTINSVTGSVDGLLTITTDYTIELSGTDYGIQVVAGGNITTLAQQFTVNYDYTPLKITTWNQTFTIDYDYTPLKISTFTQDFTVDYDYTPLKISTFTQDFTVDYDYTPPKISTFTQTFAAVYDYTPPKITTFTQDFDVVYEYTPPMITTLDQDFTVNFDYTPAANSETLYNRNRQSSIVTTIDGIYPSPTESVAGTVLWSSSVGSGGGVQSRSGGAVQGENDEWVLKQDEDYVLEIDNSSGSNSVVIINLFWYEED